MATRVDIPQMPVGRYAITPSPVLALTDAAICLDSEDLVQ